jgi:acyl-CoA oxidase
MDVDRAKRLEELRTTALFTLDKSGLSKEDKIGLSYERFRAMAKAAELTRQDILDGIPVVELFDTDTISVDTSLALICITHYVICLGTILHLTQGRDDLDDVIDELMSLETICPALLTELGYGNNVQSLETEARFLPESQEFDIHTPNDRALKFISYTGSPAVAKTGLVYARLWVGDRDCGVHPFIVPIRRADGSTFPGVTVRAVVDRMTPDPLDHAITRFDHVRVPHRMFLGGRHNSVSPDGTFHTDLPDQRAIFLNTMDRLDFAKLSLITGAQRMARISLALGLEFAAQRTIVAAGRGAAIRFPVGYLVSQQVPLMMAYAKYRAADVLYRLAADRVAGLPLDPWVRADAADIVSIAKYTSIPLVVDAITICTERCGSHAYMERNRLSTYLVSSMHANTADGDALPLSLQVARAMMRAGGYQPPVETAGRAGLTGEEGTEYSRLLAVRERMLYDQLQARLAAGTWQANLNRAHDLARARGLRIAVAGLERDAPEVAELFGLMLVREFGAWYAEHGILGPDELAGLDDRIEQQAVRLFLEAPDIRKRLGVENFIAGLPMGQRDYVTAWASL